MVLAPFMKNTNSKVVIFAQKELPKIPPLENNFSNPFSLCVKSSQAKTETIIKK